MIKNKTKKKVLAAHAEISRSAIFKAIGLMFSKRLVDRGLVFVFNKETNISLHMFFVFFTIDVLFLDKNRKVIEIKEKFRPFTIYLPRNTFMYAIELPSGTVRKSKTELKDTITFK